MIERIRFKNFKALKDAEIKLGAFNLIVGPNGSGKTSVLQSLQAIVDPRQVWHRRLTTVGNEDAGWLIDVGISGMESDQWISSSVQYERVETMVPKGPSFVLGQSVYDQSVAELRAARLYSLEPSLLARATDAREVKRLTENGTNLSGALTYIRDQDEDAYDSLREELQRWLPEFDGISFQTDQNGHRQLCLRQATTKKVIAAAELSEGTLLALALLAIAHEPGSPSIIALEEPDRALHPRLLRDVKDALYRLAFPKEFGLDRKPVQIIATTHSPYFLDLFRDHPEQIIIAEKQQDGTAKFKSLSDDPHLKEIIGDAPLGEVWYSGILGGVPIEK